MIKRRHKLCCAGIFNMMEQGLVCICVKNFIRICPPLIVTRAQIEEIVARMKTAIERGEAGLPKGINFTTSSSLAAGEQGAHGRAD